MEAVVTRYKSWLHNKPILTKSVTCGLLFILGDYIAQKVQNKFRADWDKGRSLNFGVVGTLYYGPTLHFWYCSVLPKLALCLFKGKSKMFRVLGSVALDEFVFSPILYSGYFVSQAIVEQRDLRKGLKKGWQQVRQKIVQTMIADVFIWPLATAANLWYIPLQYQVLFVNIVCLFWNVVLCHITKET